MFDSHYDLLTILYYTFLKDNGIVNKKGYAKTISKIYNENNVIGGFINLYFMSEEEMKKELGIDKILLNDVTSMFKKSLNILETLKEDNIISKDIKFIYSIEGCDYIKDTKELEILYNLGLRSILLTWNNENKYGSGFKTDKGLTKEGKDFIKKAIDLGIIIDLSHANPRTFNDIINIIKEEQDNNKDVIVVASHSNSKKLCNRERNLSDEQLIKLKNIGGYIGLLSNSRFIDVNKALSKTEYRKKYIEQINYMLQLGFNKDKILLSTDDMNFNPDESYHNLGIFDLCNVKDELYNLLKDYYDDDFTNMLLYKNRLDIYNKIMKK